MHITNYGLISLTLQDLIAIELKHLISGLDTESENSIINCGRETEIAGFTEWISETKPAITIGWDWCFDYKKSYTSLQPLGHPRSNIILIDESRKEYSYEDNLIGLSHFINTFPWHKTVQQTFVSSPAELTFQK